MIHDIHLVYNMNIILIYIYILYCYLSVIAAPIAAFAATAAFAIAL